MANLVNHNSFFKTILPEQHPYFTLRLVRENLVAALLPDVLTGCGRNPVSGLVATGIPMQFVMIEELGLLTEQITEMRTQQDTISDV